METKLRIAFNNFNGEVIINNPPHIPINGECFNCAWKDFTDNEALISELKALDEYESLVVNRLSCKFKKEEVEFVIVLYTTLDYEKHFESK